MLVSEKVPEMEFQLGMELAIEMELRMAVMLATALEKMLVARKAT